MNRVAPALCAVLFVLGGCAASSDGPDESSQHSDAAPVQKQRQTWPTAYSETSCDDWNDEMTDDQRWTASADLLIAARSREGVADGLPSNDQVAGFEEGLTSSCSVSDPIDAVADAVYKTDPTTFGE